jgi:hypothetical protein
VAQRPFVPQPVMQRQPVAPQPTVAPLPQYTQVPMYPYMQPMAPRTQPVYPYAFQVPQQQPTYYMYPPVAPVGK